MTTVRRHSSNNRVDFRHAKHSIYGSGGISWAEILTPRPFGTAPFNDAAGIRGDKNPYFQIGDAIVVSPTVVVDVRYGVSRINTKNLSGNKEGFDDYQGFGVPEQRAGDHGPAGRSAGGQPKTATAAATAAAATGRRSRPAHWNQA